MNLLTLDCVVWQHYPVALPVHLCEGSQVLFSRARRTGRLGTMPTETSTNGSTAMPWFVSQQAFIPAEEISSSNETPAGVPHPASLTSCEL